MFRFMFCRYALGEMCVCMCLWEKKKEERAHELSNSSGAHASNKGLCGFLFSNTILGLVTVAR